MGRAFLNDCTAGDAVEDVFVVANKQIAQTTNGKYYIKAFVSDRSGQMNARMWNATREIFAAMPEAGFLRLRLRIENYQGNNQAIIEQMWPAKEGTFRLDDLMPHTDKDIGQMCRRLHEICASIQNRHVAAIVQAYLDDKALMDRLCRAPAAQSFHHAYLGGLLEHTLNAMEVADAVVRLYPGLNRDLVLAGIFLHDIAKTWELSYECAFGYTDGGQLVGHIVKSAIWLEHKAKEAEAILGETIPPALVEVLQHIILSHHGLPEFGSPRQPSTPEAIVVHTLENLDAKLTMALKATRGGDNTGGDGNWTEYIKMFGGRLFRPDVAPADAVEAEPHDGNGHSPSGNGAPTLKVALNNPLFESSPQKRH